jgi:hypothetical protein
MLVRTNIMPDINEIDEMVDYILKAMQNLLVKLVERGALTKQDVEQIVGRKLS